MKIVLTAWEVHVLLGELEHQLRVANRDNTNTKIIYEKIAYQLNKQDIEIEIEKENK